MSNRKLNQPDLSKLRKRLEQPSRKTRRSGIDLRRSLGRKSVGDASDSDLVAFEQISNASSNESCHLNPDSAVIDPELAGDPNWFKNLGDQNSVLLSESSINAAYENQRDAKISNSSNVEGLNISSFNKRDINRILNSSVVVNKAEINKFLQRNAAVSEPNEPQSPKAADLSVEFQRRRPTTLRRGLARGRINSIDAYEAFKEVDQNSTPDAEPSKRVLRKSSKSSATSARNSSASVAKGSDSPDDSVKLSHRRPTFLRKGKKGSQKSSRKSLDAYNAFKEVTEQTTDTVEESQAENQVSKDVSPSQSVRDSVTNAATSEGPASDLFETSNASLELTRRRPVFLRKGAKNSRKSLEAYNSFKELMDGTADSVTDKEAPAETDREGSSQHVKALERNGSDASGQTKSRTSVDTSLELPGRRFLIKRAKKNSRKSVDAYNAFKEVMEQTTDSMVDAEVSTGVEKEISQSALASGSGSGRFANMEPFNELYSHGQKSPVVDETSLELSHRRPTFLKKDSKKDGRKSLDAYHMFKDVTSSSEDENPQASAGSDAVDETLAKEAPLLVGSVLRTRDTSVESRNASKENESFIEGNNSLPLGAEANNINGVSEDIPRAQKHSLSLKKMRKSSNFKDVEVFSQILEEDSVTKSHANVQVPAEMNVSTQKRKPPDFGNISKVSSITDHTRCAPLLVSNIFPSAEMEWPLSSTVLKDKSLTERSTNFLIGSSLARIPSPERNDSLIKESEMHSSLAKPILQLTAEELTKSFTPSVTSRKRAVPVLPLSQNKGASPSTSIYSQSGKLVHKSSDEIEAHHSSSHSKHPRPSKRVGKGLDEVEASDSASSSRHLSSDADSEMSTISMATTISLPTSLSSKISGLRSKLSVKDLESLNKSTPSPEMSAPGSHQSRRRDSVKTQPTKVSSPSITLPSTVGSDSVFNSVVLSSRRDSRKTQSAATEPEPPRTSVPTSLESDPLDFSTQIEGASDSVFTRPVPSRSNSSAGANVPIPHDSNETWSENPYVDVSHDGAAVQASSIGTPGPFEEDLSVIDAVHDIRADTEQPGNKSRRTESPSSIHCGVPDDPVQRSPNANDMSADLTASENGSVISPSAGNTPAAQSAEAQKSKPDQPASGPLKKKLVLGPEEYDETIQEKWKTFMSTWMSEVKSGKHISKPLPPQPEPNVFKKPHAPQKPKITKKKEPCPYFADYRPPKRIKPKPYVTPKMYKFLENKLLKEYKLESRIKAEEFVVYLCDVVTTVIKKKSKYHPLVFKLRDKMVSLGLIKTQFEYHLFIEEYLPFAYRQKAIPCYGCPKGPTLNPKDYHKDLSGV